MAPGPGEVCLSIASAGDNTLSLLARAPAKVIAIDLSAAQLACLELRTAIFRHLDHPALLTLVGEAGDAGDRLRLYDRLRPCLAQTTRDLWDHHRPALGRGIGTAGRFERYVRLFGRIVLPLSHARRTRAAALLSRPQAERQRFFDAVWNTGRWRLLAGLFVSRPVSSLLGRDPAFFRYAQGNVSRRTLERFRVALVELDPATNPYLHWIFEGRYGPALPHWLRPESFEPIRRNLDRLEIRCQSLETFLREAADRSIDKLNLSDVFEYVSAENADRCFAEIARVGRPEGRLAYWNTFVPRRRPDGLATALRPCLALESRLYRQDKAFFYSAFHVEEIG